MEHDDGSRERGPVTPTVKYVTWSAIVAVIPLALGVYQIHMAYVDWHLNFMEEWLVTKAPVYTKEEADRMFALRADIVTVAEAQSIKESVQLTEQLSNETAQKVDTLLISSAVQIVIAAQLRVDKLEESRNRTAEWNADYAQAKSDLSKAESYRDCLIQGRKNCDAMRVW